MCDDYYYYFFVFLLLYCCAVVVCCIIIRVSPEDARSLAVVAANGTSAIATLDISSPRLS